MVINYIQDDPKAVQRQQHGATMRLLLEEILGTFPGFFLLPCS